MSKIYQSIVRPLLFKLDAETAHEIGIESMRLGLSNMLRGADEESVGTIQRFGLEFANPIGVAAGFDKNGVVVNELAGLGFGFVEVGTVTCRPQKGNERPRLFRLPEDQALINRLGFNNDGAVKVAERLRGLERKCIVGVNIGKNKDVPNEDAVENYLETFNRVHEVADYIAVNISSPNTPGLRDLQRVEDLEGLLRSLTENNRQPIRKLKPILVKIAPDLDEPEIEVIADICLRLGIDGVIATNTTISRDDLRTPNAGALGPGGLSGRPLATRSTQVIRTLFRHTKGKLPIIGVGGIFTALDAFQKIAAGACLVQAYTGFVYGGPGFANEINRGLASILRDRGFSSLDDAVGSGDTSA